MYMSSIELFIVRICLLPLRNPLTINNLPVFADFSEARQYTESFITQHKLSIKKNTRDIFDELFDDKNRYYMYEDFIGEQFIWIEKHIINI
jgi:hypothetical protein